MGLNQSNASIRRRLLFGLVTVILALWAIVSYFVYDVAYHEVEEIYDANLAQETRILAALMRHEIDSDSLMQANLRDIAGELGTSGAARSLLLQQLLADSTSHNDDRDNIVLDERSAPSGHPYEANIAFLVRDSLGRTHLRSNLPADFDGFTAGFSNQVIEGREWRLFGLRDAGGDFVVMTGELLAVREEMVSEILYHSLWPIFISLPLIGLSIWLVVGNGLKPLRQLAGKVEQRNPKSLTPIAESAIPAEVMPMVNALNRLFQRVQGAMEKERRFTADAAHELRTPLAALKTLAQAKSLAPEGREHREFLQQIITGVDRTTHLLEQLLILARMDSDAIDMDARESVDLRDLAVEVLTLIGDKALTKDIVLAFEDDGEPVRVPGYAPAIQILLRNLIDNAILYTPVGGSVTVRLQQDIDNAVIEVIDSGPGIPLDQQQNLFQRFRRGEGTGEEGSGLGLSIVKRIVDLHRAQIGLHNRIGTAGLQVKVVFPISGV